MRGKVTVKELVMRNTVGHIKRILTGVKVTVLMIQVVAVKVIDQKLKALVSWPFEVEFQQWVNLVEGKQNKHVKGNRDKKKQATIHPIFILIIKGEK